MNACVVSTQQRRWRRPPVPPSVTKKLIRRNAPDSVGDMTDVAPTDIDLAALDAQAAQDESANLLAPAGTSSPIRLQ